MNRIYVCTYSFNLVYIYIFLMYISELTLSIYNIIQILPEDNSLGCTKLKHNIYYTQIPPPSPPKPLPIFVCIHYWLVTPLSFFQALFGDLPSSPESDVLCLRFCVVVCVGLGRFLFSLIACDMFLAHFFLVSSVACNPSLSPSQLSV